MLAAVRHDGMALRCAPPALRADPELVLEAVQRNGDALEFADAALHFA